CGSGEIEQDPDVLDTWFSSGLWPFSLLGWPDETEDLKTYYPGHVMETGHDIIFFWVARMVFFGLKFMGEKPFHTVYLHGIVRDAEGERMSKTKGNVLDPVEITNQYGTDALRFTLVTASGPGTDLKLAEDRVESNRNFANKIYNLTRFVLGALESSEIARDDAGEVLAPDASSMSLVDKWIVTNLHSTIERVDRFMANYQFHEAGRTIYEFLWSEFADWYVEAAKVRLRDESIDPAVPQTLAYVLERSLRLLHPFMPFVTEELWQRLPHSGDALIVAKWPEAGDRFDDEFEKFEAIKEATRLVRNARAEHSVDPGRSIAAAVYPGRLYDAYEQAQREFRFLTRIDDEQFSLHPGAPESSDDPTISIVSGGASIYLPLAGLVDLEAERKRLEGEIAEARQEVGRANGMLSNEQFVSKAPDHVVQQQRDRLEQAEQRVELLERRLEELAVRDE
ncbi:MAG: class I tRNA ligase family protein, partial [Thermomicrobiales bacterium]